MGEREREDEGMERGGERKREGGRQGERGRPGEIEREVGKE